MAEEKKDPQVLLADAMKKRDELNSFIKVLQEMMGMADATQTEHVLGISKPERNRGGEISDPLSVVYPGLFFGKSQPQAVRTLLEKVGRPLKTRTILECLEKGGMKIGGKKPAVNLWGVLNRSEDIFILVPKAGWGLVEQYDPKVIEKMRKQGGKENEEEAE